ncbi:MAG TPA: UDP-N-acetylmuramoyl-L-alanyl-D-glutamate--2,6-diaminopimelate ligase [Longimicrobiales bacterium]
MSARHPTAQPFRLAEVVERLERAGLLVTRPAADPMLTGIADDSRRVQRGELFCAWAGTTADAHAFVPVAESAGAAAALVERPVDGSELPQVVVRDGRRAAALAAALAYGDPAAEMMLIGVTGTNGKTTTVWLLRHLLGARHAAASLGTLGAILDDGRPLPGSDSLTTPGPVELARTLRALRDRGTQALAAEVSSHALEQGRVYALHFDAAIFINLTRDHLDYHGTEEAYRAAKRSLVERLRPDGVAVVNAEDPAWTGLAEQAPRALRFALTAADADVRAEEVVLGAFGARFRLLTPVGAVPVELPLLGAFNVQNALAAAAACHALGLGLDEIAERLHTVPQVPGRLERIADAPCPVLTDYAHKPYALEQALRALRPLVPGRLILVFGAGGERDRGKRPMMGAVAERLADIAIVTSDNPRTEDPEAIIDEIVAGMPRGDYIRIPDRRAAIARALGSARAEDMVLLAGKGHETYQIVGKQKIPFDEREVVRKLLADGVREVTA